MKKLLSIAIAMGLLAAPKILAEKEDSLKVYRLGELTVTGYEKIQEINSVLSEVTYKDLRKTDVSSVADLKLYLPSADIRTNSRGEALVFIRGCGERQLGLYLDGVPMNIPWDNRLDLNLVPTDIIGKITIDKNSNSVLFGANIMGGVVNINTIERATDGTGGKINLNYNEAGGYGLSGLANGKYGDFNFIANASYMKTPGYLLSGDAPDSLGNQNLNSSLRTNTQQERLNLYLRGEYAVTSTTKMGLSVNYTDATKGVAPETELAPADARFWKYSDWKRTLITLNGEQKILDNSNLRLTAWADNFNQTIDSYTGIDYSTISSVQKDEDFTFGARLAYEHEILDKQFVTFAFNALSSAHDETIDKDATSEFSQQTISTGLEYKGFFGDLYVFAGGAYDYNKTPKTGIFKDNENLTYDDYAAFVGAKYSITENLSAFTNLSRRSRFPTMREAYSGALGKFTVNPDLKPETGVLADLGLSYGNSDLYVNVAGFYNYYDNMIVKIKDPNDAKKKKSMRVNLADATIFGLDLTVKYTPISNLDLTANMLMMQSNGNDNDSTKTSHFEYKPKFSGSFIASYKLPYMISCQAEAEFTGTQYGINSNFSDGYEKLDATTALNLRLAKGIVISSLYNEIYVRINNITDEYILTQVGLPSAGRTFIVGLTTNF